MNLGNRSRSVRRITTLVGVATLITGFGAAVATSPVHAAPISPAVSTVTADSNGCQLGNGVKHVVQITFDNVHFFQDNPNVPSDLQLMPNLLNFFENNGTFLSNNHTPLIAHTADDILTTYTGLYGDRQGACAISNDYQVYQANGVGRTLGTTDSAELVRLPGRTRSSTPRRRRPTPTRAWSTPRSRRPPPGPGQPDDHHPGAVGALHQGSGCDVGDIATPANAELENTAVDIPKVFGVGSPEDQQLVNDKDNFKDQEAADYTGLAVHCAQGSAFCSRRHRGQVSSPEPRQPAPRPPTRCPDPSPAVTPATRHCSATATSRRNSAHGHEPRPDQRTATAGDQRRAATSST